MDNLSDLITLLNKDDINDFKTVLKRNNKRKDVKNLALLKFLETDDIESFNKIYTTKNNYDAYHALRKRFQDSLLMFISNKTFENNSNEANESLKLLVVGRYLYENNLEKIAYKCLLKAETIANKLEQFSLLNEIYSTRLQYYHLNPKENFEDLTTKLIQNQEQLNNEVKLNIAYSDLRRKLDKIVHQGEVIDLNILIQSTLEKYNISLDQVNTYKSLVQILFIANEYASINQNFKLIETYIKSTYNFLEAKKEESDHHLYYHIQILYYLANFSFRNLEFSQSINYLVEMKKLMEKQNKLYHSVFICQYELMSALNYHFTNQSDKALQLLEKLIANKTTKIDLTIQNDVYETYAMILAQNKEKHAVKILGKLIHTDGWYEKKNGMLWTIRKNMMEIIIHVQFENIEFALTRIKSFKRRYKTYLEDVNERKVLDYINLVEKYIHKPELIKSDIFHQKLDEMYNSTNVDVFTLSFLGWLASLNSTKTPYEITLDLINR